MKERQEVRVRRDAKGISAGDPPRRYSDGERTAAELDKGGGGRMGKAERSEGKPWVTREQGSMCGRGTWT